jgi:hypothetical protein
MALYESLEDRDLDTATMPDMFREQASHSHPFLPVVRVGLLCLLLAFWIAGGYAGIVYWSLQSSLLGVIASAGMAGAGAASTWLSFTGLGRR